MKLAGVDVETTCLDSQKCRIIALAIVPLEDNIIRLDRVIYAVNTGVRPSSSALIHGITPESEIVKATLDFREALLEASRYLLITYGSHDAKLLAMEASRYNIQVEYCYSDVMAVLLSLPSYRAYAVEKGRLTLRDALRITLGITISDIHFHDPISDAIHAILIYAHLVKAGIQVPVRCISSARRRDITKSITGFFRRFFRIPSMTRAKRDTAKRA